jgi:hypothetical protein
VLVYALWQIVLHQVWGAWPAQQNHDAMGLPFIEFARFFATNLRLHHSPPIVPLECVYMLVVAATAIVAMVRGRASLYEKMSWLIYAAFACLFTQKLLSEDWGYLRSLTEFFFFSAIVILSAGVRVRTVYGVATILLWFALCQDLLTTLR